MATNFSAYVTASWPNPVMRSSDSYGSLWFSRDDLFFIKMSYTKYYDNILWGLFFLIEQDRYILVGAAMARIERADANKKKNFLRLTTL